MIVTINHSSSGQGHGRWVVMMRGYAHGTAATPAPAVDPGRSSGDVHVVRRLQDVGCDDEGLAGFGGEMVTVTGSRLRFSCRGGCVQYEVVVVYNRKRTDFHLLMIVKKDSSSLGLSE